MAEYLRTVKVEAIFYRSDASNIDEIVAWAKKQDLYLKRFEGRNTIIIAKMDSPDLSYHTVSASLHSAFTVPPGWWIIFTESRTLEIISENLFKDHYIPVGK